MECTAGVSVPHFRDSLLAAIAALDRNGVAQAIAVQPLADLWPRAVELYGASRNWRGSEANLRDLIAPFAGQLGSGQHEQLLNAVIENGQNLDAADTPSLLLSVLRDAPPAGFPTHDARDRFYLGLRRTRHLDRYEDVLALLQADGWSSFAPVPPQASQPNHYRAGLRHMGSGQQPFPRRPWVVSPGAPQSATSDAQTEIDPIRQAVGKMTGMLRIPAIHPVSSHRGALLRRRIGSAQRRRLGELSGRRRLDARPPAAPLAGLASHPAR